MARTRRNAPDAPLSARHLKALRFIAAGCARGVPPMRRELAAHLGVKCANSDAFHFLARRGLIEITPGTKRGLRMTFLGTVVAMAKTRAELVEDVYEVANRVVGTDLRIAHAELRRAVQAVRDFDAASVKAAE